MNGQQVDIVLVGAGIMSATLGILLRRLMPEASLCIFESLDKVAAESSAAWNNAGTGHSAFCELNYTPLIDGEVDISRALDIAQRFEISKQLWAHLKENEYISNEIPFIHPIPHMSLVWGEDNVAFLRKRFEAMQGAPIFRDMVFSTDRDEITDWAPLIMEGRERDAPLAATRMDAGTDVNFGVIARGMVDYLQRSANVSVHLGHSVVGFARRDDGRWRVEIEERGTRERKEVDAGRVFIGAGGASFSLLHKTGIPEGLGYGGFPVSGHFLRCTNHDVIDRHRAKVYGKASVGSPPMSVPHLDTRIIEGRRALYFGPYAGFTTKFLKSGSYLDLPLSIEIHNVWPVLAAGLRNADLTRYLLRQVVQSQEDRFAELRRFYPGADRADWKLAVAGQRVQVIKKDKDSGGALKFGTEIVCSADGSITALLGASPGASTSVSIMLEVVARMFPDEIVSRQWQQVIREMIPTHGESLIDNDDLCRATRARTSEILGF